MLIEFERLRRSQQHYRCEHVPLHFEPGVRACVERVAADGVAAADETGDQHQPSGECPEFVVDRVNDAACPEKPVHARVPSAVGKIVDASVLNRPEKRQPPVTLMWRASAGALWRRSIMKSCPLGLRVIASSIAASSRSLPSDARSGRRKSAASSWPRHM